MDNVQKYLPKGSQKILADKLGVSESYVSKVLKGQRKNDAILESAIELAEEEKRKLKAEERKQRRLLKRIDKLSS